MVNTQYIYESPDNGITIYRRQLGDYDNRVLYMENNKIQLKYNSTNKTQITILNNLLKYLYNSK